MSAYFSRYLLNTYSWAPYFEAHVPYGSYPLSPVLQKCRAFRRLPPRLRELSALAKKWARRVLPPSDFAPIDQWYDDEGYELNPDTAERLTYEEIDEQWEQAGWPAPDIEVEDIPIPEGGFADPDTWEEPPPEPMEPEPRPTEEDLLNAIASRGRETVAEDYGIPIDELPEAPKEKKKKQAALSSEQLVLPPIHIQVEAPRVGGVRKTVVRNAEGLITEIIEEPL